MPVNCEFSSLRNARRPGLRRSFSADDSARLLPFIKQQEAQMHAASAPLLIPSLSAGSYDRHLSSLFPFPLSLSDPSGDHSRFLSCPSFRPADFLHNIRFAGQSRKHLRELPEMALK